MKKTRTKQQHTVFWLALICCATFSSSLSASDTNQDIKKQESLEEVILTHEQWTKIADKYPPFVQKGVELYHRIRYGSHPDDQ